MRKLTLTLTQSGLLAVLLQRQQYKVTQLAWRRTRPKHMRVALWNTLPRAHGANARRRFCRAFCRNFPMHHKPPTMHEL